MADDLPGAPDFAYRDGALHAEDVPLARIAAAVGTPFYCLFHAPQIERHYRRFAAAFAGREALRLLFGQGQFQPRRDRDAGAARRRRRRGLGRRVPPRARRRHAGRAASSSPASARPRPSSRFALAHDVHQINVESLPELEAAEPGGARAWARPRRSRIRVNPDVDARTHAKITTGMKENKFGIDLAHAARRLPPRRGAARHSRPSGIAVHIGSQLTELAPFEAAFARVVELVPRPARPRASRSTRLDLGGGLGIRYRDETPPAIEDYAALVKRLTDGLGVGLAFEPGRALVGNAGVLRRARDLRQGGRDAPLRHLDAAMNDLIRPALYDAWHEIVPLTAPAARRRAARPPTSSARSARPATALRLARPLPPLAAGDLVALLVGRSLWRGDEFELQYPPAGAGSAGAGGGFAVIRPRPSYEAVLAQDRMPSWLAER